MLTAPLNVESRIESKYQHANFGLVLPRLRLNTLFISILSNHHSLQRHLAVSSDIPVVGTDISR